MSQCQLKGVQFLHFACQGRRLAPLPPASYATGLERLWGSKRLSDLSEILGGVFLMRKKLTKLLTWWWSFWRSREWVIIELSTYFNNSWWSMSPLLVNLRQRRLGLLRHRSHFRLNTWWRNVFGRALQFFSEFFNEWFWGFSRENDVC